jgi:putative transposase
VPQQNSRSPLRPLPPTRVSSLVTDKQRRSCNARVGRTLLSDAFDVTFDFALLLLLPLTLLLFLLPILALLFASSRTMPKQTLDRKYEYRRMLPHYQKAGRAIFITFCKANRVPFTTEARDAILQHCLHDHGKRYDLHAAAVMPDHVHLLLTPLRDEDGWPYSLPTILKLLKGTSARSINKLTSSSGSVWQEESFDHVLRSQESFEEKLEYLRQNPVRRGLVKRPEDYKWMWIEQTEWKQDNPCGSDTLVRRS